MAVFRLRPTLLAAALALAATPALAEGTFSRTVFFGDSLTDAGFFRPLLIQQVGPQAAILGRFTTNPGLVWAEHLADYYGTDASANGNGQTGDNHAVGGARIVQDSVGELGPTPSLATQMQRYLASTGGRADPDALYTVWGGGNDLFAVAENPAQAQAIVGAAVAGQVGLVATLQAAGARYVLVPSIPDIGVTPSFSAQGPAASAQGTALASAYNSALYGALAGNGLRVIPLDTFSFLREAVANPSLFGFGNVTGTACQPQITALSLTCNPGTYAAPGADRSYLFADGVHPSSAAQKIVSDLAISVLEAPRQIAVLPHSAAGTGRNRAERVAAQVGRGADTDGRHWWFDARGDFQRYGHGDQYDGAGPALLAGMGWQRGALALGGFVGHGRQDNHWGQRRGEWTQSETTLGGALGWRSGQGAWVNGQISYSKLDFDIDRDVPLGPALRTHRGSTDGSNLTAALSAGWDFGDGALVHGPVLGVIAQRIDVDGFAESEPGLSTSLAYPDQSFDSLIASVGWQASYRIHERLQPYVRLTMDRELEKSAEEAFAQSQSLAGTLPYAVPGLDNDRRYSTLTLGARTRLFGLDANLGANLNAGQKGGKHSMLFASLGGGF